MSNKVALTVAYLLGLLQSVAVSYKTYNSAKETEALEEFDRREKLGMMQLAASPFWPLAAVLSLVVIPVEMVRDYFG